MKVKKSKIKSLLKDKRWRLNNLYKIKDKDGKIVKFKLNKAQQFLFENSTYRNVILKARQLGFTTFIDISFLDDCLFNKNITAGIIAHNLDDANKIFLNKIKFPYENLPEEIKGVVRATTDRAGTMMFSNGSNISASTSFRSGTLQRLHVSELAKISLKYPNKAKEIKTGAMEAVAENGIVFVESTAEGAGGYFYDLYKDSEKITLSGIERHKLEFKEFFYAWYMDSKYIADKKFYIHKYEEIDFEDYFNELENKGINLSLEQKAWYCLKGKVLKDDMKQEYPSEPDEAFSISIKGAYYSKQFTYLRNEKRVSVNCYDPDIEVSTFWDIGISDSTSIWFVQHNRFDQKTPYRIIDFYENSGEGLGHYLSILKSKGYKYKEHYAPHDMKQREYTSGISRIDTARKLGINFLLTPNISIQDGIDAVRIVLIKCVFDKKTEQGYNRLERYRKEWDDNKGVWKDKPLHDECSHASDGFRYFAVTVNKLNKKQSDMLDIF